MDKVSWIKELVKAEEQMEDSGIVDFSVGYDSERYLVHESLVYLQDLKNLFTESSNLFNEYKSSTLGRIKLYGIAKTQADFMLFRNGFKMIFSLREPGVISIRFNFMGPNSYIPSNSASPSGASSSSLHSSPSSSFSQASNNYGGSNLIGTSLMEENLIVARKGPLAELLWTFQEQEIKIESLVKYHLSLFIKESAK